MCGRSVGRWSARANGLARYRHVVGVHDAMNKADKQPLRDKVCLARNHLIKKGAIGVRGAFRPGVMPRDDVISEAPDRIPIATRCENRKVPTRTWLDATRVSRWSLRQARQSSESRAPPTVSLTMYSRRTGPSAARPSPRREYGVGPASLIWMSRRTPARSMTSPRRMDFIRPGTLFWCKVPNRVHFHRIFIFSTPFSQWGHGVSDGQ